jgi:hypothetical protein
MPPGACISENARCKRELVPSRTWNAAGHTHYSGIGGSQIKEIEEARQKRLEQAPETKILFPPREPLQSQLQ